MSRPLMFLIAPETSLIAITLPPASLISRAAQEPTLPNPCITKRWPAMPLPCSASKASVANRTPLPVAASLPNDPPRSTGFPVTTAGE
uniref:Gdh1 n=1 Tax=Arundo donax TaxID=35708 RepID=A0A0A9G9C9_ARUDO